MMLKIFVLLIFLFYFVSVFADPRTVSYAFRQREDPCPRIWKQRPRHTKLVPLNNIKFDTKIYEGGRHHIIPFWLLRDFFRFAMIMPYGSKAERIEHYISDFIDTIVAQFIENGVSIQHHDLNLEGAETGLIILDPVEEMFATLAWLPGNIFIGPHQKYRLIDKADEQSGGDPGRGFEEYANRIIKDNKHFTALKNLYHDMQLFLRKVPLDADLFEEILRNLDIVNKRATPFPFDEQDWEMVMVETETEKKRNGKTKTEIKKDYKFKIRESSINKHRNKRSQSKLPQVAVASNSEPTYNDDDDPFDYYLGFCKEVKRAYMNSNLSKGGATATNSKSKNVKFLI